MPSETEQAAPQEEKMLQGEDVLQGEDILQEEGTPQQDRAMTEGRGADGAALETASQEPKTENLRMSPAEELTPKDSFRKEQRTPVKVKGIYVSAYTAGNEAMMDNIIAQIDKTELNAVVIDFKTDDGYIAAEIDAPAFREIDACRDYIPDLSALMEKLKRHNIYTIARVVAFKDPYLAE